MNDKGAIRELADTDVLTPEEIEIAGRYADELRTMPKKARKAYYQAIRQKCSPETALACAKAAVRAIKVR